jgi:hypothetical protein
MICGLYTKWKQPVAFYLIHGNTNGEMLVNFLMEVLYASHNARLFWKYDIPYHILRNKDLF